MHGRRSEQEHDDATHKTTSDTYGELPQAANTGGGKDGCNASPKFWEVFDIQLTGLAVGRRVACDEEENSESDDVTGHF